MCKYFMLLLFLSAISLTAQEKMQWGKASFYADKFEGRMTASGAIFSQSELTAAHKTLPFGTRVKVTNLDNNKTVIVVVNDRGPFVPDRIIDVSKSAAKILGFIDLGVTDVKIEVLEDKKKLATGNEKTDTEKKRSIEAEFYRIKANQIVPKGFAVQVGSFKEPTNLIRLTNRLKKAYQNGITVAVKPFQESTIYSVLIGSFKARAKAEKFKEKVLPKYPDSFVVDFSEINNTTLE